MNRVEIPFGELNFNALKLWDDWLLLTAGELDGGNFNSMTVSWGTIGYMWGKPAANVVVRPSRHTYGFMERYDTFTLSAFAPENKKILGVLGSKSGRDMDKVNKSGFIPEASLKVGAPSYKEAELVIECRKMYYQDLNPGHFLADHIEGNYGGSDYHRSYIGEIVAVYGLEKYRK